MNTEIFGQGALSNLPSGSWQVCDQKFVVPTTNCCLFVVETQQTELSAKANFHAAL